MRVTDGFRLETPSRNSHISNSTADHGLSQNTVPLLPFYHPELMPALLRQHNSKTQPSNFLNTTVALCPPNPKVLLRMVLTSLL